ncbi:hypothetical protein [Brevundimonas goettingensis]|uniref:Fimbrial biogenesis outer membrane usher protein n=1 Tax=Brevundimonas goettingensis TaxID=2774190 RepID=A0A975C3W1_9CAUL|nr:hypothetical protein [Brevundimonas goettingensis]QTC91984.1 hypothetical protein IFJ75_03425 [Brevundimonas goettingensis]
MISARPATAVALTVLAAGVAAPALAQSSSQSVVTNLVVAAEPVPFNADDLLFMEVQADGYQLAETMNVYGSRAGVYVPLGEFARVLDFAIGVFPAQRRAEGWIGSRDRKLTIDLNTGVAIVNGKAIAFAPGQAAIFDNDLYVRADLAEQLFPVKLRADINAQTLTVSPTEPLPFQQRLAREARAAGLNHPQAILRVQEAPAPYGLFTPPAFDVNLGGQVARDGVDQSQSFDVRMAGDLLYAGFQGFLGSDQNGEPAAARVLFERKDPDGHALGRFGATRAGLGDVFTPSMSLGAGSYGGRGLVYSTAPLETVDLATPLNLRGELPIGEEVELYVNEVLQAARSTPDQGRYEFLDVPLTFGLNTIRLVFYGPQGQTREEVRRINFGSGQIEPGKFVMRLAAIQQDRSVFEIQSDPTPDDSQGEARLEALFDYGISTAFTISGGLARYAPAGFDERTVGLAGVRGSIWGVAAQLDAAHDSQGGSAAMLGLAARPFGVSIVGRHAEYRDGFVDETRQVGATQDSLLRRATDLRADMQWRMRDTFSLPLSLDLRRLERIDGTGETNAEFRTSAPVDRYYLSTSLAWQDVTTLTTRQKLLIGAADIATLVAARAQFRGGLTYTLSPRTELDSAYMTADIQISERRTLRLSAVQSLGEQDATTLQAAAFWRARRFDIALTSAWETRSGEWQVGLQMGFGFAFDFARGRYDVVRPGVSAGGSMAVNAFVDANGDGHRQPDEKGVSKIVVQTPAGAAVTGADGRVFVSGLGDGAAASMRVNLEGIDDPFLLGQADVIRTVPRPGRTARVELPLQQSGEVEMTVMLRRDGQDRPLAAVNLQLVPEAGGAPIPARSDHAGIVFVEDVPPGRYRVQLDPQQAADLGMTLVAAPAAVLPADGGFVRAGAVVVSIVQGGAA